MKKKGDDEHCKGGNNRHTDVTAEVSNDDEGGEGSGTVRSQHLGLMDRK